MTAIGAVEEVVSEPTTGSATEPGRASLDSLTGVASAASDSAPHDPVDVRPPILGNVRLTDVSDGLPRTGQWRERFAVADLDGDHRPELVATPPRKSGGTPRVFSWHGDEDRWIRRGLGLPSRRYDYGSTAAGDFDGDGRTDLAFAMHLVGVAAVFGTQGRGFEERSSGLPERGQGHGSSARMALPAPARGGDRLLVLAEAMARGDAAGLREFAWDGDRWTGTAVADGNFVGDRMAYTDSPRCGRWLAVADARGGPPALLRATRRGWQRTALPAFPRTHTRLADVAFGDFDGDACPDLAVAHVSRGARGWYGAVDVFPQRPRGDRKRIQVRLQHGWRPSALAFIPSRAQPAQREPARLAVLDEQGALAVYEHQDHAAVTVAERPAPDWRRGCAGTAVAAADLDNDGAPELLASFAGEPHALDSARCRNGGALAAWRLD